jgi:hypothetical protein
MRSRLLVTASTGALCYPQGLDKFLKSINGLGSMVAVDALILMNVKREL